MKITRRLAIAASLLGPFVASTALSLHSTPAQGAPAQGAPAAKKPAKVITRGEIVAMLATVDRAANRRDASAITAMLAPDFKASLTIQGFGTQTFNRAQYKAYSEQALRSIQKYQYQRSNTIITIAPGGQSARVTATIDERVEMGGKKIHTVTSESSELKVRGGRILLTAITGVARIVR